MAKITLALATCLASLSLVGCGDSGSKADNTAASTGGQTSATGGSSSTQGGGQSTTGGTSGGASTGGTSSTGGVTGTGGISTPTGTLFTDDFESGSGKWQITQGICTVTADDTNVEHCAAGTNVARAVAGDIWGDYTVTARIKPIALGTSRRIYLAARFTDSSNWYGAAFYNDSPVAIEIRKKVSGASSTLATSPYPWVAGQWYTVAFKVSGTTLSMSIDGTPQLSVTDTSFASGKIAFLADQSEASIDDVVVTNP
jgi:pectate lyase